MIELSEILMSIRKNFSFLWDEYGFKLTGLIPRDGYQNHGYFVQLQNRWAYLAFQSESGSFNSLTIMPISSSISESVGRWALLSTGEEWKFDYSNNTTENIFNSYAKFARPYLIEMLESAKTPEKFKKKLDELEMANQSGSITIQMIRTERERLDSLGLDSSLAAAMANLRKAENRE